MKTHSVLAVTFLTGSFSLAHAQNVSVEVHEINATGVGAAIGSITLSDSAEGLKMAVNVQKLKPGEHGIHIHEKGDCGPGMKDGKEVAGIAAGSHYDPNATSKHLGPTGKGHLGDLPKLVVAGSSATANLVAPRLKISDVRGRSIVIHDGGDNYSDVPEAGGGGARIACGVIPAK